MNGTRRRTGRTADTSMNITGNTQRRFGADTLKSQTLSGKRCQGHFAPPTVTDWNRLEDWLRQVDELGLELKQTRNSDEKTPRKRIPNTPLGDEEWVGGARHNETE